MVACARYGLAACLVLGDVLASPAAAQAEPAPLQVAVSPPPPPAPTPRSRHNDRFDVVHTAGASGIRVSRVLLDGSDDDGVGSGYGAQFAGESERYGAMGFYSVREGGFAFIGGGAAGFEGGLGGDAAWGLRVPVGRHHGPFFRAGARGYLLGNDKLYSSLLELPQLQLGYQYMTAATVIEVGWRAGPVLAGRYNTGHAAYRKLGKSFELGGHTAVHANPVHFDFALTRVLENEREGELDLLEGKLCGDASVVRICLDGRYYRGKERTPGGQWALDSATQAFYGGWTIGVGREWMEGWERHR